MSEPRSENNTFNCLKCGAVPFEGPEAPFSCPGCGGLVLRLLPCSGCGEEVYFRIDLKTCPKCGLYSDKAGIPPVLNCWVTLMVALGLLGLLVLGIYGLLVWMAK